MTVRTLGQVTGIATLVVAALWVIVSGAVKLADHSVFHDTLLSHARWSEAAVTALSWGVPVVELATGGGVLLLLSSGRYESAAGVLGALFLTLALYAMWMHEYPPEHPVRCGCGLSGAVVQSWLHIAARNGLIALGLTATALVRVRASLRKKPVSPSRAGAA